MHVMLLVKQILQLPKNSKKVQVAIKCGNKKAAQTETVQTESKLVQVGGIAVYTAIECETADIFV